MLTTLNYFYQTGVLIKFYSSVKRELSNFLKFFIVDLLIQKSASVTLLISNSFGQELSVFRKSGFSPLGQVVDKAGACPFDFMGTLGRGQ